MAYSGRARGVWRWGDGPRLAHRPDLDRILACGEPCGAGRERLVGQPASGNDSTGARLSSGCFYQSTLFIRIFCVIEYVMRIFWFDTQAPGLYFAPTLAPSTRRSGFTINTTALRPHPRQVNHGEPCRFALSIIARWHLPLDPAGIFSGGGDAIQLHIKGSLTIPTSGIKRVYG